MAVRMRNWQSNSVRRPTAYGHSVPRPCRACDGSSLLVRQRRFSMSNDLHDDEALFGGFDSLVPPLVASLHAVEQTRRLLLEPIKPPDAVLTDSAGNFSGRASPVPQTPLPAAE